MAVPPIEPVIFLICAFFADGAIDCDEKWVVYVYDIPDVYKYCYPNAKGLHHFIVGCAIFDDERGHTIILSNNPNTHTGDGTLWHEVKHLQCLCNFHANPPEDPKR